MPGAKKFKFLNSKNLVNLDFCGKTPRFFRCNPEIIHHFLFFFGGLFFLAIFFVLNRLKWPTSSRPESPEKRTNIKGPNGTES